MVSQRVKPAKAQASSEMCFLSLELMSLKGEQWRIFGCISFGDGSHIFQPGRLVKCWYFTHLWEKVGKKEGNSKLRVC